MKKGNTREGKYVMADAREAMRVITRRWFGGSRRRDGYDSGTDGCAVSLSLLPFAKITHRRVGRTKEHRENRRRCMLEIRRARFAGERSKRFPVSWNTMQWKLRRQPGDSAGPTELPKYAAQPGIARGGTDDSVCRVERRTRSWRTNHVHARAGVCDERCVDKAQRLWIESNVDESEIKKK